MATIYNRQVPFRLILNADDFGLTPGINRAVVELHQAGVLTSATLMATGPAFADAVTLARANPRLGVGCHLVFVDGMPVSHPEDIPSLLGADAKTFRPSLMDFAQAALRGTIRPKELALETQAQIQKLQRAGVDVTHIDTHKHTHCFPQIAATVLHIAERCGVAGVRNPFEPGWSVKLTPGLSLVRRGQMAMLDRFRPAFGKLSQTAAEHGFVPSGTLGIAATGCLDAALIGQMLEQLLTDHDDGNVLELCCHPGFVDAALEAQNTRLRGSREVEVAALLEVVPRILEHPFAPELIHYGDLGVPGLQRASGQYAPNTGYEKVV